jgi:hypothetical protein
MYFSNKPGKWFAALIFALTIHPSAYAQLVYNLDLDKSISLAMEKSHSMRILKEALKQSEYELRAATSRFKTHVDLDLEVPNYT